MSWTKASIKDMASKVNEDVRRLCFNAYMMPTFHLHTTHFGIVSQCELSESGRLGFSGRKVQVKAAQEAFEQAYLLLMQVMHTLDEFFELGMSNQLQQSSLSMAEGY